MTQEVLFIVLLAIFAMGTVLQLPLAWILTDRKGTRETTDIESEYLQLTGKADFMPSSWSKPSKFEPPINEEK